MEKAVTTPIRVMLKQYIALGDIEQDKLAKEIGANPSTIRRFLKGKSMEERTTIRLINWLFGAAND